MTKTEPVKFTGDTMRSAGPTQMRFLKEANASFNLGIGGYGTGKTVAVATKFVIFAESFPPDKDIAIIGTTQQAVMRNVVRPVIFPFLGEDKCKDLHKVEQRIVFPNGRSCHILGAADADSEDRIAGMNLAVLLVDEVTRIHKNAFSQAMNRMRVPGARVYATTNTDSPSHWFKRDYIDKLDDKDDDGNLIFHWKIFHFELADNPSLTAKWKKDQKRRLMSQGKAEYDRGVSGLWADHQGMVYNLDGVFGEVPRDWDTMDAAIGCDWATDHACVFLELKWKVCPSGTKYPVAWVTDELVLNNNKESLSPYEIVNKFKQWRLPSGAPPHAFSTARVPRIHIDPSARPLDAAFREQGIHPWKLAESGTYKHMRNVDVGISRVQQAFHQGRLKVSNNCRFLADSLRSYVWDEKAIEKGMPQRPAKDGPDDACDALRYAVVHNMRKWF